ncbi:WG repeat-containing protein [Flavobacterium sp. SUN052]|uniref:WG repeat-containing protein n=1 Tax=Flavobacterium sp. SUN052 TaxID=3002441 RepID=UPI00237E5211|nr:WG repeat-containing protein [Flavobacterium sp. SUN052]MEC4004944.1 WG repeat-containing protein [Flavobacterium sp. SUN052]
MKYKLLLFTLFLIFNKSKGQIMLPNMEFDAAKSVPNIIYYPFYNGIQMIEIDYNNFEKARVDFEDARNPINSIRKRFYGHNSIILRNEKGELVHQYNLRGKPYVATDFASINKSILIVSHLNVIEDKHRAKSNYPFYGKYNFYVTENNKAGIIDTLGKPILDVIYDGINSYNNDYKVSIANSFGYFNDEQDSNFMYTMLKNGKWGFKTNQVMIEPKYEELIPIKNNVLRIKKSEKFGLINFKEKILIKPIYTDLQYKTDFYLYANQITKDNSEENTLYGIINSNFKIITKPIYKNIKDIIEEYKPSGKYWAFKTNGFGAIDKNGKEISEFKYSFEQQNPYQKYYRTSSYDDSNKQYILDMNFKEIGSNYDLVYHWKNSLFLVKKGTKYGLINLNNQLVLPCEYDSILETSNNNELGTILKNGKYGVLNSDGKIIIPCEYDYLYFTNNKIAARILTPEYQGYNQDKKYKCGLLNNEGKIIIPLQYDSLESLNYGLFKIKIDSKFGIIKSDNILITPIKYDDIYDFKNGFCIAKIDFGFGYINQSGKEITHFYYDKLSDFEYNSEDKLTAKVVFKGKEIIIDVDGKKIE